jgi:hypothetical protein
LFAFLAVENHALGGRIMQKNLKNFEINSSSIASDSGRLSKASGKRLH